MDPIRTKTKVNKSLINIDILRIIKLNSTIAMYPFLITSICKKYTVPLCIPEFYTVLQ